MRFDYILDSLLGPAERDENLSTQTRLENAGFKQFYNGYRSGDMNNQLLVPAKSIPSDHVFVIGYDDDLQRRPFDLFKLDHYISNRFQLYGRSIESFMDNPRRVVMAVADGEGGQLLPAILVSDGLVSLPVERVDDLVNVPTHLLNEGWSRMGYGMITKPQVLVSGRNGEVYMSPKALLGVVRVEEESLRDKPFLRFRGERDFNVYHADRSGVFLNRYKPLLSLVEEKAA